MYEEQRRKLRRSSFFKGMLFATLLFSGVFLFWRGDWFSSPHIAMFDISGEIFDDPNRDNIFKDISENDKVYGLLVRINSPGGSVVGAEAIYNGLRQIAKKKPVVVTIGEVGASAAYIAALAGDKIFARENSLVGSIGVIVQYPDLSKLAQLLGISVDIIKSGDLKGGSHILKGMDEKERVANEILVNESFMWFKKLVSERRKINVTSLDKISDGRLFTGRMALDLGLIDSIGSTEEAITHLKSEAEDLVDLPIKSWNSQDNSGLSLWEKFLGFPDTSTLVRKVQSRLGPILFSIAS